MGATESDIDNLIDRGLEAVDAETLETAEQILDDARTEVGENHVRVLHLAGMLAWAQGDIERATGFLMQATDQQPERGDIYLDCAECLFLVDEIDEAEAAVRAALALPSLSSEHANEGRLLLAQIRLADDDPEEALEVLEQIDEELKTHPAFLAARGSALLSAGKADEAVGELRKAIAEQPDDSDLHYQVAIALEQAGDQDQARAEMLETLRLDLEAMKEDGLDVAKEPDYAEVQEIRSRLEDVFEQLPDPVLKLVASAPIKVQAHASEDQVRGGTDPRSIISFEGKAKSDDEEAELESIVVMRDLLVSEVEDDDELEGELFYALMEEIQRFFDRDDIVVAEA